MLLRKKHYLPILKPIVEEYRKRNYEFWLQHIDKEPIVFTKTKNNIEFQIEICAFWDDKPNENIRIMISIDDSGLRAYSPVTNDFIISPSNEFIGE